MIDYIACMDALEQKTAALEAALSHNQWELAISLMDERLAIMAQLASEPITDPVINNRLKSLAQSLQAREQEMVASIQNVQTILNRELHEFMLGNKAAQIYKQNR